MENNSKTVENEGLMSDVEDDNTRTSNSRNIGRSSIISAS